MIKKIDWSRELWYTLFFVCLGFTVWPLMIYYLGQALSVTYFLDLPLRTWAESKLKSLDQLNIIKADFIVIDGKKAYETIEQALEAAKEMGCEGYHVHTVNNQKWYMPCKEHNDVKGY